LSLLEILENKLLSVLSPILGPIKGIVSILTKFKDNTVGIFDAAETLVADIKDEYVAIRDFKSQPHWRSRVISAPRAVQTIQDLVTGVPQTFIAAVEDLIQQLRQKITGEAFNIEELEGVEDLRGLFTKIGGRLGAGFEKVLGALALILDALTTIRSTIDDLQTIVDDIRTVREDLENLDGFFLPQNNKRRLETRTAFVRIGKLHS